MDAGAQAEVMSMALAKTVEAHGTKKRKHPAETTADKHKAIALSKPPSPGSLIKQVQVMSLLSILIVFFHLTRSTSTGSTTFWVILHVILVGQMTVLNSSFDQNMREADTDFL